MKSIIFGILFIMTGSTYIATRRTGEDDPMCDPGKTGKKAVILGIVCVLFGIGLIIMGLTVPEK